MLGCGVRTVSKYGASVNKIKIEILKQTGSGEVFLSREYDLINGNLGTWQTDLDIEPPIEPGNGDVPEPEVPFPGAPTPASFAFYETGENESLYTLEEAKLLLDAPIQLKDFEEENFSQSEIKFKVNMEIIASPNRLIASSPPQLSTLA